jgi:hypothetical protein
MRPLRALAILTVAGAAACAKTPPATPPVVALAPPAPPARLIIPVELPEYVAPLPQPTPLPEAPPAAARSSSANRATDKPTAPPSPQVEPIGPILQTTPANPSALEQRIAGMIAAASEKLNAVNVRELTRSQHAHWSQARDFIRMANDALRVRNYVYAEQLATKANQVANLLTRS